MVGVDDPGDKTDVGGVIADDAEFKIAVDQLAGNLARKASAYLDLHLRVQPAILLDVLEEVEGGGLVGADDEATGRVVTKFGEGVFHLVSNVLETARVFEDDPAGVGEEKIFPSAIDQSFSDFVFQTLDGEGDGRLGPQELLSGAGEAFFRRDGLEHLQRVELHSTHTPLGQYKPSLSNHL